MVISQIALFVLEHLFLNNFSWSRSLFIKVKIILRNYIDSKFKSYHSFIFNFNLELPLCLVHVPYNSSCSEKKVTIFKSFMVEKDTIYHNVGVKICLYLLKSYNMTDIRNNFIEDILDM